MKTIKIEFKRLMAYLAFICSLVCANAQNVTIDGLKYYLYPEIHEAVLNNGNTWSGELDIPSEVKYNGETFTVTGMTNGAFNNCSELTKVRIPKTINHIVHGVLTDDPNITGQSNPEAMNPFYRSTALEVIEVDEDNPIMSSEGGILYSKDKTRLYAYPAGLRQETFIIPDRVTWIGMCAICHNRYLSSLTIPNSVTYCGSICDNCTNLKTVSLPENLTYISAYSFDNCKSLKSIEIPDGVTYMGESVFRYCSSLESIVLPDHVSFVGGLAFFECTSLETIKLSSSLSAIDNSMFNGCSNLKTVAIPDGITVIGQYAFKKCTSLKEMDLPASVTNIGWGAFQRCKFDHLIIRGRLRYFDKYIFDGLDTSTTIYTQASQVQKIKNIYEGAVLPLEKYPSGILSTKSSPDNPSPVYNLQGRLAPTPQKGVYIQNGKKVIVK